MIKMRLYRMWTTIKRWFSLRKPETEAEIHRFTAQILLCCGLEYALFHFWFGWDLWNTSWRIPALGNLASGVINALLISVLLRFEKANLRQHIERWRYIASANLLLWLFDFAWLIAPNTEWSLNAFTIIYLNIVNLIVILVVLYGLRRLTQWLPETSKE